MPPRFASRGTYEEVACQKWKQLFESQETRTKEQQKVFRDEKEALEKELDSQRGNVEAEMYRMGELTHSTLLRVRVQQAIVALFPKLQLELCLYLCMYVHTYICTYVRDMSQVTYGILRICRVGFLRISERRSAESSLVICRIIAEYSRNLCRAPAECSAEGLRRTFEGDDI